MEVSENGGYLILGVLIIRILLFRVLYWDPLFFGNSQIDRSIETGANLYFCSNRQPELGILRDVFSSIFVVVLLAAFQRFPQIWLT